MSNNYKYHCDICGRPLKKKIRMYGHTLCSKHMHQFLKYGHPLDANPRTANDPNEYRYIEENTIEVDTYNQRNEVSGHFLIDAEDIQLVKHYKWREDSNLYVLTGNCTNTNPRRELSRMLMGCNDSTMVVDHINGDPTDNRKQNLRVCTQSENLCNRHYMSNNSSGMIGISWDKRRNRWTPEIMYEHKRVHLGRYKELEEAKYVRWYAETLVFKQYQNDQHNNIEFQDIPSERKEELKLYVLKKLGNLLCRGPEHAEQHSGCSGNHETHL